MIFAPAIVAFFVPEDPAVIAEGATFIRVSLWSAGFIGLQYAMLGVLRAAGEMLPAMAIGLASQWLIQLPLAYFLSRHTTRGLNGLWWSMPSANVAAAMLASLWFLGGRWKRNG